MKKFGYHHFNRMLKKSIEAEAVVRMRHAWLNMGAGFDAREDAQRMATKRSVRNGK
jgi:hypothetical protein